MKRKILTLYYAFKDPRTPLYAKLTTVSAILYLLSPIDLVPDIVPVAGYIDDLVVVPLLLGLAEKLLPPSVKFAAAQKAAKNSKRLRWMVIILVAAAVIALLLVVYHYVKKSP